MINSSWTGKVKTHAVGKAAVRGANETVDDVEYKVYTLAQRGPMVILF